MAVVDAKGTMKDFCSVSCLSSFKSVNTPLPQPPSLCTKCSKPCAVSSGMFSLNAPYCQNCEFFLVLRAPSLLQTTCELTLNETVHKFCSHSCLQDFCRDSATRCESCGSTCNRKPLTLMLDDQTRTICSDECLKNFKKVQKSQS